MEDVPRRFLRTVKRLQKCIETGNTALLSSVPTSASINFIKKSSSRSRVVLHEHHKSGNETLFKIKNPQPMYANYPIEKRKLPKENGRYGFDLAEYDWLPPHGRGREADFYVVRDYNKLTEAGTFTVGAVEFERGCGYYLAKNTGCTSFQTAYHADTNAAFKASMPVLCEHRNMERRNSEDYRKRMKKILFLLHVNSPL